MKQEEHATQFCPVCGSLMRFVEDKANPNNKFGYLQLCEKCYIQMQVDKTGISPANSSIHTIKHQALLRQKFPGLQIVLTKTDISIAPLPNILEIANETTVCFVWLLNQFRKEQAINGTQFDISKKSTIGIGSVRATLAVMQQANLINKTNKAWQFNREIAIKFPRVFPDFKHRIKRGQPRP